MLRILFILIFCGVVTNAMASGETFFESLQLTQRGTTIFFVPDVQLKEDNQYSCSPRKSCKQMSSCDEARYHLTVCGNKRLDRDKDGIPCENICR